MKRESLLARAEALARDRERGAAAISRDTLLLLEETSEAPDHSETTPRALVQTVADGHPRMAPLHHAWAVAARLERGRDDAPAVRDLLKGIDKATSRLVDRLADHLGSRRRLATLSASATVLELASRMARRGARIAWTVSRSVPGAEGERQADALRREGMDVDLVEDSAFPAAAAASDGLLVGIDALTSDLLIHKVGTWPAALACRERRTPVWCVGGPEKWLPASFSALLTGLPVRSDTPLFDETPTGLLEAVATPEGLCAPERIEEAMARFWGEPHLDALRRAPVNAPRQARS